MSIKIVTEQEFKKNIDELNEKLNVASELDTKKYTSLKINWDCNLNTWDEVKRKTQDEIIKNHWERLFFLGHSKDTIEGKPQLINQVIQRIPVVRIVLKKIVDDTGVHFVKKIKFFDEKFDKRYDGKEQDILAFDFWVYRIIDKGREYFIFSPFILPEEYSVLSGMKINLDDTSEFSSTLKIKKIASVFIVYDAEPKIKTLDKENLIQFVKEKEWDETKFHDYFFTHPDGNIYDYTEISNLLRKAQILSGKYEGYPIHPIEFSLAGTGKSINAEAIDASFNEEQGINEAGNSTLKTLIPSFKEKPANLGYIVKCHRVAIIDELMKMVEQAQTHDTTRLNNYLGQLNMILEHKKRNVGSGNDNSTIVKATAKVFIKTNPLGKCKNLTEHIGVIDPTFLSRLFIWVQNKEETERIYNKEGVRKSPQHIANSKNKEVSRAKNLLGGCLCDGGNLNDEFLTIYDSCQVFLVNFDYERCKNLFQKIVNLTNETLKQVWRARGLHHTILLLDGIVKHRCLFRDYDKTFTPIDEDYKDAEKILTQMVEGWGTQLIKKDYSGGTLL